MKIEEILGHVDHTLLSQTASWDDIRGLCDEALKYRTASVCISPSYVCRAKEYVGDNMAVCTVIGFPNGYNTVEIKAAEAADAVKNGADEVDMVINLGWVKDRLYDKIEEEIRAVKKASEGRILKVIIETCFLTDEEKIRLCGTVTQAGADYIKTSTGFGGAGAAPDDIRLFSKHIGNRVKIKAAGGISSLEDAECFLKLGADRLGTSRIVKLVKQAEQERS